MSNKDHIQSQKINKNKTIENKRTKYKTIFVTNHTCQLHYL